MTYQCFVLPLYYDGNTVPVHTMREYEGVKVKLHSFLNSPVHGGEYPATRRACLVPVRSFGTK